MSPTTIASIIGFIGLLVYRFVIVRLVRRWLLEGRISDTQAAFLLASRWSLWFLYGAIIVAVESRGINGAVLIIFFIGALMTLFGAWNFHWFMPDLRASIRRDWLRKRSRAHEDGQGE